MRQHGKVSEVTEKKTAVYVDDQQRILIRQLARGWLWRSELPTWLLIVTVYGGWFACVAGWRTLGLFPATLLLIWFTAWYMSLQHELIHGHPTRLAWFNQLLGTLPLAVWYPYGVYRDSHLAHHRNHLLTHPEDDPESYYVTAESWQRFSAWQRRLIHLRNTFWGRLLLAPMMDIIHTLNSALRAFREGDRRAIAMWSLHLLLLTGLLTWMAAQGFSPAVVCAGGELPGAGPDQSTLFSRTPRRG
ncbi:putative fatty acid desaturase [Klebsiella pneumoniae]|nr:putative fatty acid desaturase [Klebsiella pneumoniae]